MEAGAAGDGVTLAGRKHALSGAVRGPSAAAGASSALNASSAGSSGASGAENGAANGESGDDAAVGLDAEEDEEEAEDEAAAGNAAEEQMTKPGGAVAKRVRLTLGQKREVVDLAASKKFTHRELAQKFRVGRTTITNICRQEDLIRTETDSADATKKRRKTTKCTYDLRVLDECLHKWRMEVRVSSPETKLTGTVLQQKAMDIACKILRDPFAELPDRVSQALSKFSASNGWLDGYRTRFGSFSSKQLSHHSGSGEYSSAIKNVDVQTRLRELHLSFQNVELQDIWAGSEFAVIFNPSMSAGADASNMSGVGVNGSANGRNSGNDNGRFTVSLFVSAAGETFDLQVIGTDRSPIALRGVDTQRTYRVHYGYSKTGWQVAHTTVAMLKALNARARARKRTFRVILDSAVPHVKAAMILDSQGDQRTFFVYDHLQIYFLPPNFKPPRFHPCHLGLAQAFKARFRYELVETVFGKYRQSVMMSQQQSHSPQNPFLNLPRVLHTRNVMHWLHVALESLSKDLIQQCWLHSGLLPTQMLATLNTEMTASTQSTGAYSTPIASNAPLSSTGLPNAHTLCQDLQSLLADIAPVAPEFIRWLGVPTTTGSNGDGSTLIPNAIAFTEMEGNAAVTDPGIDEVQLIRSVLQKHGMLSTVKLDELAHPDGQSEFLDDVEMEQVPRREEVLLSIDILKKYLRLSGDAVPNSVQTIVELNRVKTAVRNGAMRNV